ncbi:MAG: VIT1/CCC1 transporter family protein [Candidatus Micrarchaeota archaeon]|nr:VIT1/CCC1 transporter family protein [Candidatus Micrarchaeota archaeon]
MAKTKKQAFANIMHTEEHEKSDKGSVLRQIILGGQDGLVNVLGIVLGLAAGTNDRGIVILGGLAATFAESISMAAVAYTSGKAQKDYYYKELEREKYEIKHFPDVEREEIRLIYMKKGFKGKDLDAAVNTICSDEKQWLETMMSEELGLSESKDIKPVNEGFVVGFSAIIGSLIPMALFFLPGEPKAMMLPAIAVSIVALFATGAYKAKSTLGSWWKSGIEMAVIGIAAALVGYGVGVLVGANI